MRTHAGAVFRGKDRGADLCCSSGRRAIGLVAVRSGVVEKAALVKMLSATDRSGFYTGLAHRQFTDPARSARI